MTDFIKELLAIKIAEGDNKTKVNATDLKVDDEVHSQLNKAEEDDAVDTQCFGLEMEDGKVVKVYVKQDQAEEFEEAMTKRLGEDDDIQGALEELGRDFEIIDIVWPEEEESDEEKEENEDALDGDGSESLNQNVYGDDAEMQTKKQESLTYGQRIASKLNELKWSDEESNEYTNAAKAEDAEEFETDGDDSVEPDKLKTQAPQGTDAKWNIDKDKDGMTISNDRFSIELDDVESIELMTAVADKKIARFKNEQGRVIYVFSPRGSEYILKTPEYKGGFRIPKDIVNKMLD